LKDAILHLRWLDPYSQVFNSILEGLSFEHCELGSSNTMTIVEAISISPITLKTLDLTYNKIEVDGARALANLLIKKPSD
jgi:hypothetical protein